MKAKADIRMFMGREVLHQVETVVLWILCDNELPLLTHQGDTRHRIGRENAGGIAV